ncbi:hypothetical protein [Spirulina major]|uniref:hypothetical protein n=1 Tax=Spirulina major TaxID=270636 RepID=UPI00093479DE|nr:hypothetical protein [Spirulina major]
MFDELTPLGQEVLKNPVAFLGGFCAGALRLNLNEDPVKTWLAKNGMATEGSDDAAATEAGSGPQSISID